MRWTEVREDDIPIGIDGCGVVTFGLTLNGMAGAFARLAAGARKGGTPAAIVLGAMKSFPESVAGTDRMCTDLMRAVDGRIVAKTGAEGVYCAAIPGAELGIALKVEDGARRAAEPALVAVLRSLGLLSDREMGTLSGYAEPEIRNTRGELAGRIRAVIELETGVAGVEGGG
jgi:L-asparaginase II